MPATLEFTERGRSDFLRLVGVHHTEMAAGQHGEKLVWIVRRMEIDFRSPARIDDVLSIRNDHREGFGRAHLHAPGDPARRRADRRRACRGRDHFGYRPAAALSQGVDRRLPARTGELIAPRAFP